MLDIAVEPEGVPPMEDEILDSLNMSNRFPTVETINRDDIRFGVDMLVKETDFDAYGKKKNTSLAYDPKVLEFKQFCDCVFKGRSITTRYDVDQNKVYGFFLYVAFRESKKRGRRKSNSVKTPMFDVNEWNRIAIAMKRATTGEIQTRQSSTIGDHDSLSLAMKGQFRSPFYEMIVPENGVGFSTMVTTKAAVKKFWLSQVKGSPLLTLEPQIFGCTFQKLMNIVQERKPRQDRKNFVEKIDKDSAPMESVTHINLIEEAFFNAGVKTSGKFKAIKKSVHASLRNRFTFLCTTCGILRGESMFKGELSDLFTATIQLSKDPHPFMLLIMQISTGKMNQNGLKIFGRMGRNFDVNVCPVGALGFYLMYRFHHSRELNDDKNPVDWTDNSMWFNIKLLTEYGRADNTVCINDSTYATAVKKICKENKIPSKHWVHIGRVLGSFESEINEDLRDDIRNLGNWGLNVQETRYSTKLPMKIIRSKAHLENNINWNPRVGLEPPDNLRHQVFPWLQNSLKVFENHPQFDDKNTARLFLTLLEQLQTVVIQDAAALAV